MHWLTSDTRLHQNPWQNHTHLVLPCKQYQNIRRPSHSFNSISDFSLFSKCMHALNNISLVLYQDLVLFYFPLKQKKLYYWSWFHFTFRKVKHAAANVCSWTCEAGTPTHTDHFSWELKHFYHVLGDKTH